MWDTHCGADTMNKKTAARLDAYQRRYRALAAQLADIGYMASGTLAPRSSRCGKANCACHADPPRLHGPYWHLTFKVDGKTVNRRLSPRRGCRHRRGRPHGGRRCRGRHWRACPSSGRKRSGRTRSVSQ